MTRLYNAFTLFLSLLVEALPFLLLGVLLSSLLLCFTNEKALLRILPKNPLGGAFAGSLVGFLFPACECGNVPVTRRLILQGAPPAVAMGFLLAAPVINPIVIWSTWVAFRDQPEIVVLRVVFTMIIATLVGWVFSAQKDLRPILQRRTAALLEATKQTTSEKPALLQRGTFFLGQGNQPAAAIALEQSIASDLALPAGFWAKLGLALDNTLQELRDLGGVLVLGSAVAALIQTFAPRELILGLGQGPVTSVVAMLVLGTVVSICSTVDAFFALAFASSFTSGALLAFLVLGPMVDLKGLGMLLTVFRPRAVTYLFFLTTLLTFLLCLAVNFYLN
ncbi:permease [Synechococcus elongatus]|uniref:Permease n=1 Tax=Synechococcus elongatus PCC 11802 TaxID=2283154 RepID=A0AAT9JW44_SYNEL